MEALCHATGPALNISSPTTGQLKPQLQPAGLEFAALGGEPVFLSLSSRHKSSASSRRFGGVKRGGQVWSLDFRCEAAAGVEDTISSKTKPDSDLRKAVNGVHSTSNVNGFSIVTEDAIVNEAVHGDQSVHEAQGGDATNYKAVVNGSANGATAKRAVGNGSTNGYIANGVAPQTRSSNATVNGAPFCVASITNPEKNEAHANGSLVVTDLPVNGTVNETCRLSLANGSASVLPELDRNRENGTTVVPMRLIDGSLVSIDTSFVEIIEQNRQSTADDVAAGQRVSSEGSNGLGILKFLKGKHILVTGATGFLAKVMVEKILRVQPDVGQLYLVIQPQKGLSADDRLKKNVFDSQLFKVLRSIHGKDYEEFMTKKLTAVSGTISTDGLGINSDLALELSKKVDVVVNSAATTTFDERYDVALNINTQGPRRVLDFAKRCPNLQLFLHVSTAFVNGQRQGRTSEKPFKMGDSITKEMQKDQIIPELNVVSELELSARTLREADAEARQSSSSSDEQKQFIDKKMIDLGMTRAQLFGWQDTYVFSKALGEMLLNAQREDIPMVVLRPSVVESTLAEPFPGWMEGIRMMDPIVLAYGKGQMTGFLADPQGVLDVIPADMVVNALLAAMAKHAHKPGLQVYQVASSVVNPMTFNILADVALELFTKDPMLDRAGNPIRVQRMKFVENMIAFSLYMWFKYQLPLQLSAILPWMRNGKKSAKRNLILQRTLEQFKYLANIYRPYTFYAGRFDVENTESLAKELSVEELERFGFNVRSIDWADYLYNVHIPGLRQYVLKGRGTKN